MNAGPHHRTVVVWGVPTAIERGETFGVKVGLKCTSECKPEGWTVAVRDHEGKTLASATLGLEPWPGTAALYYAHVQLTAPDDEGRYIWEAFAPAVAPDAEHNGEHGEYHGEHGERHDEHGERSHGHEAVHSQAHASFNVTVVPAPECRLTVVAIDKESRSPVKGAKVVVHPYRAFTDERGVAEVHVPRGTYRLFVSGRDYFPFRWDGEATADTTIGAELESDLAPSEAELWS